MAERTIQTGPNTTVKVDTDKTPVLDHADWLAEARRRFGNDTAGWRFRCSTCGHEASVGDHAALAPEGQAERWGQRAPFDCLGRSLLEAGKGVHARNLPSKKKPAAKKPIVGATHNGLPVIGSFGSHAPCDWTTGGLFGGGAVIVINEHGNGVWAFAFADPEVRADG